MLCHVFIFNGFVHLISYSVLGKRLGKSMGVVAKEVKAMSQENILAFEKAGEVTLSGHCLKLGDIKVLIFSSIVSPQLLCHAIPPSF